MPGPLIPLLIFGGIVAAIALSGSKEEQPPRRGIIDDHSRWNDPSRSTTPVSPEMVQRATRDILERARREAVHAPSSAPLPPRMLGGWKTAMLRFARRCKGKSGPLWAVIDVSGSMPTDVQGFFLGQLDGISKVHDVIVIQVDTHIRRVKRHTDDFRFTMIHSGGGTDLGIVFDLARHPEDVHPRDVERLLTEAPCGIMLLTDGLTPLPAAEDVEGIPVLWVLTEDGPADRMPFGEITVIPLDGSPLLIGHRTTQWSPGGDTREANLAIEKIFSDLAEIGQPTPQEWVPQIADELLQIGEQYPDLMFSAVKRLKRDQPGLLKRIGQANPDLVELVHEITGV